MKKALIVWGGWEGHTPEAGAARVAALLEAEGFAVDVQPGTAALADPAVRELSLVVPIMTMWKIEKPELENLLAAVKGGVGLGGYHGGMADAFRQETELFFDSVVREDRSVLDLIKADYTFLNERLAKHYGIPDVYGSRFRRVTLPPESKRGGLLRQGSVLAVTSYATRTSPIIRGVWFLDSIFGAPPPPPLPNVPSLDESTVSASLPMRERLAAHRSNGDDIGCIVGAFLEARAVFPRGAFCGRTRILAGGQGPRAGHGGKVRGYLRFVARGHARPHRRDDQQ